MTCPELQQSTVFAIYYKHATLAMIDTKLIDNSLKEETVVVFVTPVIIQENTNQAPSGTQFEIHKYKYS